MHEILPGVQETDGIHGGVHDMNSGHWGTKYDWRILGGKYYKY